MRLVAAKHLTQDVAQEVQHAPRGDRIPIANEDRDRIEAVEEEARMQLHPERAQSRLGHLCREASGLRLAFLRFDEVSEGVHAPSVVKYMNVPHGIVVRSQPVRCWVFVICVGPMPSTQRSDAPAVAHPMQRSNALPHERAGCGQRSEAEWITAREPVDERVSAPRMSHSFACQNTSGHDGGRPAGLRST